MSSPYGSPSTQSSSPPGRGAPAAPSASPAAARQAPGSWWSLARAAASGWVDDRAQSMGASLAYYTVFSAAPLLLIVIAVAGLAFGEEAARGALFGQLRALMGDAGAEALQGLLGSASKPGQGIVASVIGVVVLLLGATTVFGELQDALDRIWRAPARDESSGLWRLLRTRVLSFGMILAIGFLLTVLLVASTALTALGRWWGPAFGEWKLLAQAVNQVVSFALVTAVFGFIYKLMPRVDVRWHDVWVGAAVTALLFTLGKYLIGLYIGHSGAASGFGAAGSVIVLLLWVYYSAQIFLFGAELTWAYARTRGSMMKPAADAPPSQSHRGAHAMTPASNEAELAARYDRLREELRQLLAAPAKDMTAVYRVIDELDATHMAFKSAHGIEGNNPRS